MADLVRQAMKVRCNGCADGYSKGEALLFCYQCEYILCHRCVKAFRGPGPPTNVNVLTTVRVKAPDGGDHPGPHQTVNFDNDGKKSLVRKRKQGGRAPSRWRSKGAHTSPAPNRPR